jgi:nicotinamide phosphoribosyltransferase
MFVSPLTSIDFYKDPKTSDGLKKSHKGFLQVHTNVDGVFEVVDGLSSTQEQEPNELRLVFSNGVCVNLDSLSTIRERISNNA